ncbi:MAG: helix-turn-helix domain-containing protein [Candidatus Methanofastidiosia archaeon]
MYIPRILGTDILFALIEHGENLTTIVVPPSIYELTSERVKIYLEKARINLEKGDNTPGRPTKYTKDDIREIVQLKENGMSITQISLELDIPRRTVYYLLEKEQ